MHRDECTSIASVDEGEATPTVVVATLIAVLLTSLTLIAPRILTKGQVSVTVFHGICALSAVFVVLAAVKRWRGAWLGATVLGGCQMAVSLPVTVLVIFWLLNGEAEQPAAASGSVVVLLHSPLIPLSGLLFALGLSAMHKHPLSGALKPEPVPEIERALAVLIKAHRRAWWPTLQVRGATISSATHETRQHGDLVHFTACLNRYHQRRSSSPDEPCRSSRRACFTAEQNLGHSLPSPTYSTWGEMWRVVRTAVSPPATPPKSEITPPPDRRFSTRTSFLPAYLSTRRSSHFQTEIQSARDDEGSDVEFAAGDMSVLRANTVASPRRPSVCFSAPHHTSRGNSALSISSSISRLQQHAPPEPSSYVRSSTTRFDVSHFEVQQERGNCGPPSARRRSVSLSPARRSSMWDVLSPNQSDSTSSSPSSNNESIPTELFDESPSDRYRFLPSPVPRIPIDAAEAMRAVFDRDDDAKDTGSSSFARRSSHKSLQLKTAFLKQNRSMSFGPRLPGNLWMHGGEAQPHNPSPVTVTVAPFRAAKVPWAVVKRVDGTCVQVTNTRRMSKFDKIMRSAALADSGVGLERQVSREQAHGQ